MKRLRKFSSHPKFDKERRKHLLTLITMSNEGKKRLFILLFLFVHSYVTFASSPSTLRGGLVYQEKTTQGPVYVNIETVTLFRKADPSILAESAQMSRTFGNRYQNLCRQVANRVTLFDAKKTPLNPSKIRDEEEGYNHPFDIHFSPFKYPIIDAPQVCKEMGGRRPEIRDRNSLDTIRFAAIKKGVNKIAAGIQYDASNNIFRFVSDDANVRHQSPFSFLEYGGYYEGFAYKAPNWEDEYSVKQYAANYPIIYNHPNNEFVIRLGDNTDKNHRDHIMCEVPKPPPASLIRNENNILLQVTDHNCKRDELGLIAATNVVINEIEAITNLNISLPEDINSIDQFLPKVVQNYEFDEQKKRRKRSLSRKQKLYLPRKIRPIITSDSFSRKQKLSQPRNIRPNTNTDSFSRKQKLNQPRKRPIIIKTIPSRKQKRQVLQAFNKAQENWDTISPDPIMVELYNAYKIRVKAKYPTPPFDEWLLTKALQLFYKETNDQELYDTQKLKILYDPTTPPMSIYREYLIKKFAKKTLTGLDIKNGANLYRQSHQFRKQIDQNIDSLLLSYLKTEQYEGLTRWDHFKKLTSKHTRRYKREVTIVNKQIAQLYNFYQIRKLAGHPETPFKQWLLVKTLATYYDQKDQYQFYAKHWTKIYELAQLYPIVHYEMEEIQQVANRLMSPAQLKMEARNYQHHDGRRQELDDQMVLNVIQYLKTDKMMLGQAQHLTRWNYYQIITVSIVSAPIEKLNAISRATTPITTTTQRPTTTTRLYRVPTPPTRETVEHNRTKRTPLAPLALAGIGLGTAAAVNMISSSVTGDAPFSWGGKTMGALFGLKTSNQEDLRQLQGFGQAVDDLKVNQAEIVSTMNVMGRKMETIVSAVDGTFKATATMVIEQDLKMYIRHLLMVQQSAIQKYAHIMLAASVKHTSPYALSQKELDVTADELKMKKGIIIVRDLSSTRMSATIINNELYLQIEIPIIQENNLFNFYQIKPIPIFTGNLTLMPQVDATAIAISKTGSDYAVVSADEFDNCIHRPWQCHISTPIIPMSQNSHCVASTYTTQEMKCPIEEKQTKIQPFFHIDGNFTIYSVPQETRLYVKCSESNLSNKYKDEAVTLRGIGEAVFKHSCTITMPNGAKFTTPAAKTTENTSDLKIFELLKIYPVPTGIIIKAHDSILPTNSTFTELSLLEVQVPTKAELTYEAFHPLRSIPFLIRVACVTAFIVITILLIRCFWPTLRSWLGRTWYCCCWGPTSEEEENERREENSRRIQRLTDEMNIIKANTKIGAEKWKNSTASILSSIHRARSMSSLNNKDSESRRQHENLLQSTDSLPPPPPLPLLTPTIMKNTRIVYKADPPTPATKRVSFNNGRTE